MCREESYSPIRHLATIVCPPWMERGKVTLTALTFAFDAGGDDSRPCLTVAGFASSVEDWDKFSVAWKERLKQDGADFFHAVSLASFSGLFKHWREREDKYELRKALSADLMHILKSNVYRKFACTVVNKDFNKMSVEMREEFALCAYSLAGRTCEKHVREYILQDFSTTTPFFIVFEDGDRGKGKLQKRLNEDGASPISFLPKKDTVLKDGLVQSGFVPLQAADWLAYELNLATQRFIDGKLESESQLRWPMQEFLRAPFGYMGTYTPENFADMESQFKIRKEIEEWANALGLPKHKTAVVQYVNDANAKGKTAQ